MIYVKIAALFLSLTGFGAWAWWGQASGKRSFLPVDVKTVVPGVSPEVRSKAFDLLDKVVEEARAAKDKEGGLAIQFSLADLLWEKDEARARRLFSSIVSTVERERCGSCGFFDLSVIAARDAKLAVGLDGLSNRLFTPFGSNRIYEHLANQYPDEALRIGRRAVANDTYFEYLDPTAGFSANASARGNRGGRLGKLYAANRSYGANLARDISAKLRGGRLDGPIQYPNYDAVANILSIPPHYVNAVNAALPTSPFFSPNANRPPGNYAANTVTRTANYPTNRVSANYSRRPAPSGIPFSAAAGLLAAAVDSAEQNPGEPPMLTVDEMRSLASAMVQALIRTRRFDTYQVLGVWPELKKYAPRETARLQRLLTRSQRSELGMPLSPFEFPQANIGDVTDDLPVAANETKAEKEEREFVDAARWDSRFDCPSDRANNAARFAALPNVDKYPDLVDYFADDLPLAYAKAGKIEKVRSLLADEDDRLVKLTLLGHTAAALAAKADRGSAAKLLDEAAQFVPGDLKTSEEFRAAEVYALGLSRVDPGKAFDMTEKLLDKANRLLNIRSELAGFSSGTEDVTPAMDLRQRQVAVNSSYAIAIIRVLAHADFARTVKLADRFSEQGQHLFFRWYIVNALLNRHAEEDQQRFADVEPTRLCG